MATATAVHLTPSVKPEQFRPGVGDAQSKLVSKLLQKNHDEHHIYFNEDGFHNHIVHHLLTIWSLNATPEAIQKAYDDNADYQREKKAPRDSVVANLSDPQKFIDHLGPQEHYADFLSFFKNEIQRDGWERVVQKFVFSGEEQAETMFVRLYAGFLHPIIHLGYGIEFQQPAIVAEGLAQCATHDTWIGDLFLPAEEMARKTRNGPRKAMTALIEEISADHDMRDAVQFKDGNKIRDGILKRASERMLKYAAQYRLGPEDDLTEAVAEMTNAAAYFTAAAQKPPHIPMFDFFYMHSVNSSIFFPALLRQPWLSRENKVRLVEWKVRLDLAMYASRGSPTLDLEEIRSYKPKQPSGWDQVMDRVCTLPDDGHASKLIRALAHGQRICEPYETRRPEFRLRGNDWLQIAHMVIDSVETPNVATWVRSTGFDEAWTDIPNRANL